MKRRWRWVIRRLALLMMVVSMPSWSADGVQQLNRFIKEVTSARGEFVQTQRTDQDVRGAQQMSGYFLFLRPGRFIWEYQKPYQQLLQSDGKKLYIYDKDLQQVTVNSLDQSLESSPAAILFGGNDLSRHYQITALTSQAGVDWAQLTPKNHRSQFEKILLGFQQNKLVKMQLFDAFGHVTDLELTHLQVNMALNAKQFQFVMPKNVTVAEN